MSEYIKGYTDQDPNGGESFEYVVCKILCKVLPHPGEIAL